jgi:hypothetical protein
LAAVRGGVLCIAAFAVLLLAACGGGSSSRLSAADYRVQITKIKHEAASAESNVALGLKAHSLAELRGRLDAFSAATQRMGDEVAKLNPPSNAVVANTELAQGMHETARATHKASAAVAGLHTPREAIAYLETSPANNRGARHVNDALAKLTKLGYTTGS